MDAIFNVKITKYVRAVLVLMHNATQLYLLKILVVLPMALYAILILVHVQVVPLTMSVLKRGIDQTLSASTVFARRSLILTDNRVGVYVQPTLIVRLVKPVMS